MLDVAAWLLPAVVVGASGWWGWRRLLGGAKSTRRAVVRALTAAFAALAISAALAWNISTARDFQLAGELVSRVETNQKVIALTFDDGPTAGYTDEVLATLAAHRAKATFFVIGADAAAAPAELRKLVAAGHEIGNHTWSHPRLVLMSTGAVAEQITRTDEAIRGAGFTGPILVRPPYGKRLLAAPLYLAQQGRTTAMWSLEPDSIEAIASDPQAMRGYVGQNVRPGDIVLFHVMYGSRGASREALGLVLADLQAQGYHFVTVSELMALRGR